MVRIASFRVSFDFVYFVVPLVAAGIVFLMTGPVAAQSFGEQDRFSQRETQERSRLQERPSGSSANLPDWAEPSIPENGREGTTPKEGGVQTKAAPPPGGEPVPVDGGLAFLVVAGGGYAVRKLRETEDDEEEMP